MEGQIFLVQKLSFWGLKHSLNINIKILEFYVLK